MTIDVRQFIQNNYTPYMGDESFLYPPTAKTLTLLSKVNRLLEEETQNGGVLDIDTSTVSTITSYEAGYIDKDLEEIVGLQTDKPLKRALNIFGGLRMAKQATQAYNKEISSRILDQFKYCTTHNDGVFRLYTDEIKKLRHAGVLTGLPDAYGRGRIIGDYRRVALYGVDRLIEEKEADKKCISKAIGATDASLRLIEELFIQIKALKDLKEMAKSYGFDISLPAKNAREAIQWTYFAYLGAIKEQNGAAMSLGRVSTFFDIYIERDIKNGTLTEQQAQELIDHFVLKLRLARQLRTPEYNELFGGDPTWTTESLGGMGEDGRTLVTKTTYRFLNTLYNLGSAPEPNLTVLWSDKLPSNFKKFCAKVSIDTDAIQYENDDLMRPNYGDDYAIACCVSAMKVGKQMQFFGARCNLAKLLLLSINGGRDENTGEFIAPEMPVAYTLGEPLNYDTVMNNFNYYMKWLTEIYIQALNMIHYSHDKYSYEGLQMSLHDTLLEDRFMACGIAGLSVVTDSLSAIKYAKVFPQVLKEIGIVTDYKVEGSFPKYGNDIDEVDSIAQEIVKTFSILLKECKTYRQSTPTLSILTITSNVAYGKKTGTTPDGRKKGEPFAPGANPMHNREENGALASLNSVASIPYSYCRDGVSNTFSIVPESLGRSKEDRINNLTYILDGYFKQGAHHLNVNVMNRSLLMDAYEHPEKYPNLTIRVSGYAVNFHKLSREQQKEVISRTFHGEL
jgi:formate C-acetyltransferase